MLKGKCRSEKWELYLCGVMTIKVGRVGVEVLPRGVPPFWLFTNLATDHTIFELCLPLERGMGMVMPLAVPVLSEKFSGTCVSTAPAVDLPRCPSLSLWSEAPLTLLQLPCPRALRWQTALALLLQCAAQVLTSPCRVVVAASLQMVLFMA